MSEKALREFAKDTAGYYAPDGVRQLCRALLEEEPDVVRVLRWLKEWQATFAPQKTGYSMAPPDISWMILEAVINEMQQLFAIRLTEDGGWEWTEEKE